MDLSPQNRGHIFALITVIFWGLTFISTKYLLQDFSPLEILISRFILGYLALLTIYPKAFRTQGSTKEKFLQEIQFALTGLFGITLYFLMQNMALNYTLAGNVAIIAALTPFNTAILSHFLVKKISFNTQFFIGFFLAIFGVILISTKGKFSFDVHPKGDILALLSGLTWALYSIQMIKISTWNYPTLLYTRRIFGWALIFMIPALFLCETKVEWTRFTDAHNLLNIAFLGLGASALCFFLWNKVLQSIGPVTASTYIYLVPVLTVIFAALFIGESLTLTSILGCSIVILGLYLSKRKTTSHPCPSTNNNENTSPNTSKSTEKESLSTE